MLTSQKCLCTVTNFLSLGAGVNDRLRQLANRIVRLTVFAMLLAATVPATAQIASDESLVSPTVNGNAGATPLPDDPPVITSFSWQPSGFGYHFFGSVADEDVDFCVLHFGGILQDVPIGDLEIDADGNFEFFVGGLNIPGVATAQATDPNFQDSNIATTGVN